MTKKPVPEALLLASDLDGTLLPPTSSPERTRELEEFGRVVAGVRGLSLAYVTGRHLESALRAVEAFSLPWPDHLGCQVGTALYARAPGGYREVPEFRSLMAAAMNVQGDVVREALAGIPGLALQGPEHQGDFKASFVFPWPSADELLEEVRERLAGVGARTTVVASRNAGEDEGLLDVLPEGGAKDRVLRYLAETLGVGEDRVLFAGDSRNDLAALLSGVLGVVVGNASPDFVEEVRRGAARLGDGARVHFATRPYAAGVLEGMGHFGLLGRGDGLG